MIYKNKENFEGYVRLLSEKKPLSIKDRLNALEAGRKLASVTVKEDIEK